MSESQMLRVAVVRAYSVPPWQIGAAHVIASLEFAKMGGRGR